MEIPKKYRLAYASMAIELLRPLASNYVISSDFDPEALIFLEWNDPRPEPDILEVKRIIYALRAVEDSVETVYSEAQTAAFDEIAQDVVS